MPVTPPEVETFRPACSACNTAMDFERRFTPNQRAVLFPAAIQTRGPPFLHLVNMHLRPCLAIEKALPYHRKERCATGECEQPHGQVASAMEPDV